MIPMPAVVKDLESKRALLEARLGGLGRVLVAYSGGVDSAYLAWAAHQALGNNMLAIIADSPSLARTQLADANLGTRSPGICAQRFAALLLLQRRTLHADGRLAPGARL
jgi:PP-loop superfamily ATP-utilizing enzyme